MTAARRALVAAVAGIVALVSACGVEVPDDVAQDVAEEAATTTTDVPATTETPTSDDELEQALIDNGYTGAEATCGAENLREVLEPAEVDSIVEADTIEDISPSTARAFADSLRPCVEDGAGEEQPGDDGPEGDDDGADGGGLGRMPDLGDDSDVDVSRSRFLSALISGGIADEEARCIVEDVFTQLDQDDINTLFRAEDETAVPDDVLDTFNDITERCR